ncbi:MAG TPA: uracil-DNA glycosylase [Acidimicrobiales bacterium]|jgi:uracil-DNA glycosylase family 4
MSGTDFTSLAEVHDAVVSCRACPRLVEWRERVAVEKRAAFAEWDYWGRPVPGFGDPSARMIIVGLAPAAHGANRTGRMFTGDRSGDVLYASLHRTGFASQAEAISIDDGLTLTDAWITSPVRCAPPANKPTNDERDACRPFLEADLSLVPWTVAVVLGGFAYATLARSFRLRPRPKFGHGIEVPVTFDGRARTVLCSYHVSQQNTFTGRLTPDMLDVVFRRARALL